MSNNAEKPTNVVNEESRQSQQEGGEAIAPTGPPSECGGPDSPGNLECMIDQVKGAVKDALDSVVQSGSVDQLRGYANEAMGKTKMAVGLAVQSPELTIAGLAQTAIGEVQKLVGEEKSSSDGNDALELGNETGPDASTTEPAR